MIPQRIGGNVRYQHGCAPENGRAAETLAVAQAVAVHLRHQDVRDDRVARLALETGKSEQSVLTFDDRVTLMGEQDAQILWILKRGVPRPYRVKILDQGEKRPDLAAHRGSLLSRFRRVRAGAGEIAFEADVEL